jgi:ABC-type sugar transport system permease subunit
MGWGGHRPWRRGAGYLLVVPGAGLAGGLSAYAVAWHLAASLGAPPGRAGALRYERLVIDPAVWSAAGATLGYLVITTVASLALGVLGALALDRAGGFRSWVFPAVVVPWAYPAGPGLIGWERFLLPPVHTAYSDLMGRLQLAVDGLLGPGSWGVFSVAGFTVWRGSACAAVVVLSVLAVLPRDAQDAARLEGLRGWRVVSVVLLPLLRPALGLGGLLVLASAMTDLGHAWWLFGRSPFLPALWVQAVPSSPLGGDWGLASGRLVVLLPGLALLLSGCLRLLADDGDLP